MESSRARHNLRQALQALSSQLGNALEEHLIRSSAALGFAPGALPWIDYFEIDRLIQTGRLDEAHDLAVGEVLPELDAEWVRDFRLAHRERRERLLERLAQRHELAGDIPSALALTQDWLQLDPFAEPPRRELIRRFTARGDNVAAAVAIKDLLDLLGDRGMTPSIETRRVIDEAVGAGSDSETSPHGLTREAALIALGQANERRALEAATYLALAELTDPGVDRPVLVVDVAEGVVRDDVALHISFPKNDTLITLEETRALLIQQSFSETVLQRAFDLEESDDPAAPRGPAARPPNNPDPDAVPTTRAREVVQGLRDGQHVALIGQSASGKTVTATQAATALTRDGWSACWLDLSDPSARSTDLLRALLRIPEPNAGCHLIVLDDIQANPGLAKRLASLLPTVAQSTDCHVQVLALAWDSAHSLIHEHFPSMTVVQCSGEEVLSTIADEFTERRLEEPELGALHELCKGDLLIARLALQHFRSTGSLPAVTDLARAAFDRAIGSRDLSPDALRVLYALASLGRFEVDASRSYARGISVPGLNELTERHIIRQSGDYVSLGHRTLASLIALHLARVAPGSTEPESPIRLTVDYLRTARDRQVMAMLERLDLAGKSGRDADQHGVAFLGRAWDSLRVLTRRLGHQAQADPTWGDNVASAVHACESLARFEDVAWRQSAGYVRSRWQTRQDGQLPEPVGDKTPAERDDFDQIVTRMQEQDDLFRGRYDQLACDIDADRFHRTWVLGQLLGFEGTARERDDGRLNSLLAAAQSSQEPDGAFYPRRVPWVTARVVLGLAIAGESIRSSEVQSAACEWLRRPHPTGPLQLGSWESGTGTWNSTLQTTAMCLSALARAGVSTTDSAIKAGRSYLLSNRGDWVRPGNEMDAADSLQAYLLTGGRWREVSEELAFLLGWSRNPESWSQVNRLASESQDESSKIPNITSALIGIIWETVRAELPLLLEGLAIERDALGAATPHA